MLARRRGQGRPGSPAQARPALRARAHRAAARSPVRRFSSSASGPPTRCIRSGATFPPPARSLGIGNVAGVPCMIMANDATVKAGAFFPQTAKKIIRAQRIAFECALPIIYLVDSAGVFLPMQDEIFPDEDDFGRIFRNNSVISAAGIPQFAAIMGNCVAGGAYLPVLCDKILMTEGSGLYLAGPSLVKAAIGQIVDQEELGGAKMHAEISGTVDFYEKDDPSCLEADPFTGRASARSRAGEERGEGSGIPPPRKTRKRFTTSSASMATSPTTRATCWPRSSMRIRSTNTRPTTARRSSRPTRASAADRSALSPASASRSAPRRKASRWAASSTPTAPTKPRASSWIATRPACRSSFSRTSPASWSGKDAEQSGIIRSGAKLVNAVSNSVVPKITVVVGGSFGAGNYALCGKAYDPRFILAWPQSRYAVMGAAQASDTVFSVLARSRDRGDKKAYAGRTRGTPRAGESELRRADRHPLRRRPRLDRRDHPAARDARRPRSVSSNTSPAPRPKPASTPAWCRPETCRGVSLN